MSNILQAILGLVSIAALAFAAYVGVQLARRVNV